MVKKNIKKTAKEGDSKKREKVISKKEDTLEEVGGERKILIPVSTGKKFLSEKGIMFEEKIFYTFKSRMKGLLFYKGDDGNDKKIKGLAIRDDITPREREDIIQSRAYKDGLVVEWAETPVPEANYNALNDHQINVIIKEYNKTKDFDKVKGYIENMTSVFSVNYFKEKISTELPGSIAQYCESRIEQLKEEQEDKAKIIARKPIPKE